MDKRPGEVKANGLDARLGRASHGTELFNHAIFFLLFIKLKSEHSPTALRLIYDLDMCYTIGMIHAILQQLPTEKYTQAEGCYYHHHEHYNVKTARESTRKFKCS